MIPLIIPAKVTSYVYVSDPLSPKVEDEEEDEFQFVSRPSPQLLKEGLYCSERRPLFRGAAREKA
jgi:hypothetical protein